MIRDKKNIAALACCAALLLIFFLTAKQAWSQKGETFDEPLHLLSSVIQVHDSDFRCDPEDPPLWKYYVAAGRGDDGLAIDKTDNSWKGMLTSAGSSSSFAGDILHAQPGNMDAAIKAGRSRMIFLAVALGALICWWAWRLAGKIAAIVALGAFCLDPNFLANSVLVKNDVVISLAFLALMAGIWLLGERATLLRLGAVALLLGAAITTKFSGVLEIPVLCLSLGIRALLPQPWRFLKWTAKSRGQRLATAAGLTIAALLGAYCVVWAAYGFRFGPSPHADELFNSSILDLCKYRETLVAHGSPFAVSSADLNAWSADWHPSFTVRVSAWLMEHRLLPQTWLEGFLYTYATSIIRPAFLSGESSVTGWWYYFPLAMAFKTPLATIGAISLAAASLANWKKKSSDFWPLCMGLFPAFYMAIAMRSHLNLGLRHVLPIYPFLFIFLGVAAARSAQRWPRAATALIAMFLLGLGCETCLAFPDYLPFFNAAAGGSRGGLRLLNGSNLDWGQDLPALAKWQSEHRARPLYLCYFGSSDPRFYGIHYVNLPGSFAPADEQPSTNVARPVVAISASILQGIGQPHVSPFYEPFLSMEPIQVLGGTIYLYDAPPGWPQPQRDSP